MDKEQQKQLITEIMNEDAKDGLYEKQTAVEYLINQLERIGFSTNNIVEFENEIQIAKEMEKQQHKNTWFDSTAQFDNAAEMTYKKTFEQYYNEEYRGNNGKQ